MCRTNLMIPGSHDLEVPMRRPSLSHVSPSQFLIKSVISLLSLVSIVSTFTSCARDPNVRKQKYAESGERYFDKAKYQEAAIQFSNAIQIDPAYPRAHFDLAKTY